MISHVKQHWLKYYLAIGGALALYGIATSGLDIMKAAKTTFAWPLTTTGVI